MILLDLNQVTFSAVSTQFYKEKLDEELLRHLVLNMIRSYRQKFYKDWGEIVICSDSASYWRRAVFPYYKSHRKKARDQSGLDWVTIFKSMDAIKAELKEYFPYKFMMIDGAEADDIIAVLSKHTNEKVLILSGDKDFIQLHNERVKQYSPIQKKWVTHTDPSFFLKEHIIFGDRGDGIPNIASADNTFAIGARQKTVTRNMKDFLFKNDLDSLVWGGKRNYLRNKQLIDLTQIPKDISINIEAEFDKPKNNPRSKIMNYFIQYKLKNLMANINEF